MATCPVGSNPTAPARLRNILDERIRMMAPGAGVTICGAGSADSLRAVKLPAVKQKIKHKMAKVPSYA